MSLCLPTQRAAVVALLPTLLALAACGGGGSDTGSASTSTPTASSTVTIPTTGSAAPTPSPTPVATPTPTAVTPTPAPGPSLDATALPNDPSAITLAIGASSVGARPTPFIAGVGTHFALSATRGYETAAANRAIQALGMDSFRDDIYWNAFAPAWDLYGSHLEPRLGAFINATSARPFLILNNGNPNIPDTLPPTTDAARSAFAAFALRAVRATAGHNALYELWNEWNLRGAGDINGAIPLGGAGDGTDPRSAVHYARLAHKVVDTLKAADTSIPIIVGGVADDPGWAWTKAVIGTGIMKKADGYSVHLYNQCNVDPWRSATHLIKYLDDLQVAARGANDGTTVPIYISEYSWPTGAGHCLVDADTAAAYASQFMLYAAGQPWVRGAWFYELIDSGSNRSDMEDNFGLYYEGYREKPSTCQIRESISLIKAATAISAEQPKPGLFITRIRTATGVKAIAWTGMASKSATLRVGGIAPYSARPLCGEAAGASADRLVRIGMVPVVVSIDNVQNAAIQLKEG